METCSEGALFSILSFLGDYKEILRLASRVCKRWNSVLNTHKNLLPEDEFESSMNTPPTSRELHFLFSQGNVIILRSKKDRLIVYNKEVVCDGESNLVDGEVYHVDSYNRKILYTRRTGIEYTRYLRRVIHSVIIDSPIVHNLMCVFQYKIVERSNGWLALNLGNPRTGTITRFFSEEIDSMNIEAWIVGTDYRRTITINQDEGNVVTKTCYLDIGTSILRIEITAFLF